MENKIESNSLIPSGTIIAYAGKSIPQGWELCDGREVPKTDQMYSNLYDAIKNIWGGTGNPNFQLPNLGNKFLRGAFSTNEVNLNNGGNETHSHGGSAGGVTSGIPYGISDGGNNPPAAMGTDHTHGITSDTKNHLPPFINIVYLIKL